MFSLQVENRYVGETAGPFLVTVVRSGDINVNTSIDFMITTSSASSKWFITFTHLLKVYVRVI